MRLYETFHPDQRFYLRVQTIAHEFEFTVRRDEADRSVILESRKSNTLVEFDVFHLDRLASRSTTGRLKHHFVVQPQTKFGHTTQVALHLDGAQDL